MILNSFCLIEISFGSLFRFDVSKGQPLAVLAA